MPVNLPDLKERLAELRAKHRAFLDDRITDQELMTDVLLEWERLLKLGELAAELTQFANSLLVRDCIEHQEDVGEVCYDWCARCQLDKLIARYDALEAGE